MLGISATIYISCACDAPNSEPSVSTTSKTSVKSSTPAPLEVSKVVSQILDREVKLPADLLAFRDVMIYPKVPGFVDWIGVDRGSSVKAGELLIRMNAPELPVQTQQNTSQALAASDDVHQQDMDIGVVRDQLLAAQAKARASADTYERLKGASASYAGIVAGNDLEIAQKTAEADAASVASLKNRVESLRAQGHAFKNRQQAAQQATKFSKVLQSYLQIRAAFDGKITERNVHEGSFVHPPTTDTTSVPLLRLQQLSMLRLVVPVPETDIGGIVAGAANCQCC
jgi:multidrug resistance efflux pump